MTKIVFKYHEKCLTIVKRVIFCNRPRANENLQKCIKWMWLPWEFPLELLITAQHFKIKFNKIKVNFLSKCSSIPNCCNFWRHFLCRLQVYELPIEVKLRKKLHISMYSVVSTYIHRKQCLITVWKFCFSFLNSFDIMDRSELTEEEKIALLKGKYIPYQGTIPYR